MVTSIFKTFYIFSKMMPNFWQLGELFTKYKNSLWLCWFVAQNPSDLISLSWKLYNQNCHIGEKYLLDFVHAFNCPGENFECFFYILCMFLKCGTVYLTSITCTKCTVRYETSLSLQLSLSFFSCHLVLSNVGGGRR